MPISMNCPQCDEAYTLADRQAGKKVRCKTCEHVFVVEEPRSKRDGFKAGGPGPRLSVSLKLRARRTTRTMTATRIGRGGSRGRDPRRPSGCCSPFSSCSGWAALAPASG